jgi:hypothetical protein
VPLEKKECNALFLKIVAGGLNPGDCKLTHDESYSNISHPASGSLFGVYPERTGLSRRFVVRRNVESYGHVSNYARSTWGDVLVDAEKWAGDVATPDYWSDLVRGRESLAGDEYERVGNLPFSGEEQAEIGFRLREITEYVKKTYALSGEQSKLMEERFKEAEVASQRVGRKDWLLLFSGTLFTLIVAGVLTPEIVQHVLAMSIHDLGHLFGFTAQRPPQIPPRS